MSVASHTIASGDGWQVHDVICSHGPQDRPFEEQHGAIAIAAVTAGTFQYRTRQGAATLVPGGLLLGNHGACYECGHAHGVGDRCLAFHFTPSFFEAVAADIPGTRSIDFKSAHLPPDDATLPLLAEAQAARDLGDSAAFEELSLRVAGAALTLPSPHAAPSPSDRDARRISEAVRRIEADPTAAHSLATLARGARMSAYHFLRTFRRVAGMTPHQFILRARLTRAALRLRQGHERVTAVAFEAGFNDLSTFNRRFRRLLGATPRAYRSRFQNRG